MSQHVLQITAPLVHWQTKHTCKMTNRNAAKDTASGSGWRLELGANKQASGASKKATYFRCTSKIKKSAHIATHIATQVDTQVMHTHAVPGEREQ